MTEVAFLKVKKVLEKDGFRIQTDLLFSTIEFALQHSSISNDISDIEIKEVGENHWFGFGRDKENNATEISITLQKVTSY